MNKRLGSDLIPIFIQYLSQAMENLNTVSKLKTFCKKNSIPFSNQDNKEALLDKVEAWEDAQRAKKEKATKELTARQFGQLKKIGPVMIQYLEKQKGKGTTMTHEEWTSFCKEKKVID